ncbi:hypothetical protein [Sphingobacterium paludis]|jgi:hypothetical protein|uniref:Uncharacterized protein n=1 Tax=Sphingobacterium paludis TaxID=1476465 RepID=A0A4R7D8N2_9SPHI|nr:hypothetical protein [Sphingobacterium paludis]TDS17619.1 hypothetical protein B0I21_101490 [Sphingobacterium paludis]
MFTFIILIFFAGFLCLMNTSKRISWPEKHPYLLRMSTQLGACRLVTGILFALATLLSILLLGIGSGIFSAIVMLMAVGCVCVLFFPFRYISRIGIASLFFISLLFELLF